MTTKERIAILTLVEMAMEYFDRVDRDESTPRQCRAIERKYDLAIKALGERA